jgi:hypothetical protein
VERGGDRHDGDETADGDTDGENDGSEDLHAAYGREPAIRDRELVVRARGW